MWDVGWPFYGLDQVEVAADGDFDSYFNELLSAAGMDLLRLPVWNTASGQTDGLFGDDRAIVHDPAAMLLYPAAAADGQESLQESFPFQPVVSRLSGGMPGVLFPMLALREDAQEQDVLWAVDALSAGQEQLWSREVGLPDETDILSAEMLPVGVQDYSDDGIRLGLDPPFGQPDAAGGNLWKKAAASSVAVSPVTVSSRADGVWGAAQQLPFSGAASDGGKAASRQQADSVDESGGLMAAHSGVDGYLPAELMWEQEDRLLDRLERRLGQEIANSTEGAFG